jgi:C4-type Zn-finger protein
LRKRDKVKEKDGGGAMAKLTSERELTCPCCGATLVVDLNLGRIIEHREPPNPDRPELSEAEGILAKQAAKREALFQQSVQEEKTRGDALSKRFEEALKQANKEPVSKPLRGFDLD